MRKHLLIMLPMLLILVSILSISAAAAPTLDGSLIDTGYHLLDFLTPKLHFVTFGGDPIDAQVYAFGTPVDLTGIVPVREGYAFTGWYRDPYLRFGITQLQMFGSYTVYAGWTKAPEPEILPEIDPEPSPAPLPELFPLPYTDVPESSAIYDDVRFVYDQGLMRGIDGDTFSPRAVLTRAELAELLWALNDRPQITYVCELWDVSADHDAAAAIRWAVDSGAMTAENGFFDPDAPVDHETLAIALYGYVKANGGGFVGMWMFLLDCTDRDQISEGGYEPFCWLTMKEIITMQDGRLSPKAAVTRAETAGIVRRLCEVMAESAR